MFYASLGIVEIENSVYGILAATRELNISLVPNKYSLMHSWCMLMDELRQKWDDCYLAVATKIKKDGSIYIYIYIYIEREREREREREI